MISNKKKAKSNQVKDENLLFPLYSTPQKTHGKMETTDLRPVGKKKINKNCSFASQQTH